MRKPDTCQFSYGGRNVCGEPRSAHEGSTRYIFTHGFVDPVAPPTIREGALAAQRVSNVIAKRKAEKEEGPFVDAWNALRSLAKSQKHSPTIGRCSCGSPTGGPAGTKACIALLELEKAAAYLRRKEAKVRDRERRIEEIRWRRS